MDHDRPARIGFAGAGGFAAGVMAPIVHALPGAMLQAVAARDPARAAALEPAGRTYTDYRALMDDPEVDAVYVVLSNDLHAPVAQMALEAGKPVLCEKPLALNSAEVDDLFDTAARTGGHVMEGFWNRWHPRQRDTEELVSSGVIGQVTAIESGFHFTRAIDSNFRLDPARGGGSAYDVMCYPISFAMSVMGDRAPDAAEIIEVDLTDEGVDLMTRARLLWADGTIATVSSGFTGPERRWCSVGGTQGSIELSEWGFSHAPEPYDGTRLWLRDAAGSVVEERSYARYHPRSMMMADFAEVAVGRQAPSDLPMTEAHSRAVMRSLDLVHAAMGRG